MRVLKDVAATGYPNHTAQLIYEVLKKGHKTIKTQDGTRLEGYKSGENIIINLSNPKQNIEETFLYKP